MADAYAIVLHPPGAESGAGSGAAVDIGSHRSAVDLQLRASLVSSPLTVTIETSPDGATGWRSVGAFAAVASGSDVVERAFDRCERFVRAVWPIGTGASFAVDGLAHTIFATRNDLATAMPAAHLAEAADNVIAASLIKASADVEAAFGEKHALPLTKWDVSVRRRTAAIAAFLIEMPRAFLGAGLDALVDSERANAEKWLERVSKGEVSPVGIEPAADLAVQTSSGNPDYPDDYRPRFSNRWGDFG